MPTIALILAAALAGPADGLVMRTQAEGAEAAAVQPAPQAAAPFVQPPLPGQAPAAPSVVYQGPPGQALSDPAIEARINAQIQALMTPPSGGFTVQRYARPENGSGGAASSGTAGGGLSRPAAPLQQAAYPQAGGAGGFPGQGMPNQGGFGQGGAGSGGPGPNGPGFGAQGQSGFGPPGHSGQAGYPNPGGFPQSQGSFGGPGGAQGGYPGQTGGYGAGGPGAGGFGGRPGERLYAVARAGDTVYASLDQGFNSDDPQAPIFATVYDVDGAGQSGPLHGIRLIGQIVYSTNQAAIQFTQIVLVDGRQYPLKAYAISPRDARTGVSRDVDDHAFERFAGLFAGALIQGAGQAGQLLLQTNRNLVIDPVTGFAASSPGGGLRTQAALGALLPLGQTATAVGAQNFNKPATIAGAPGLPIGVVFLEPPALPRDAITVGAPGSRRPAGISRLN